MQTDDSDLGVSMKINATMVLIGCAIAFMLGMICSDKPHAESIDVSAKHIPICYIDVQRRPHVTERYEGELK